MLKRKINTLVVCGHLLMSLQRFTTQKKVTPLPWPSPTCPRRTETNNLINSIRMKIINTYIEICSIY